MTALDTFVWISGSFSVLTTIPIAVLAVWSAREARELRRIQAELAVLMTESGHLAEEMRLLQHAVRQEQQEAFAQARQGVKDVTEAVEQVGSAVSDVGGAVEQVGSAVTDVSGAVVQVGEVTAAVVSDLRDLAPPPPPEE